MTCIVGIGDGERVWMGGDRAAVAHDHYLVRTGAPKIFRRGPYLIGYTRSFRMGQLLEHSGFLPDPDPRKPLHAFMVADFIEAARRLLKDGGHVKVDNCREENGIFLVGVGGQLFICDDDFNVRTFHDGFGAVGSGESVAHGALFATAGLGLQPEFRLKLALEAASQFVTTVCPPFDFLSLDPAPGAERSAPGGDQ